MFRLIARRITPLQNNKVLGHFCFSNKVAVDIENGQNYESKRFEKNSEYSGWKIIRNEYIDELGINAIELLHKKLGTQYVHLMAEDTNNVFSINFRTTPMDNTGVAHILEHTTLCGSKKYPIRDPFMKMLNRSVSTFMNALTGSDVTFYPFSSQNEKDFMNLMSVYLDAVFDPMLNELDFLQEGWRFDFNENSNLIYKGVVFNEMKGVYADSFQILARTIINKLLPSNTYGYDSGGDPKFITSLTYKKLKEFHSTYYHPSNAKIFSYGSFPLENNLKFLESYLTKFESKVVDSNVASEVRWNSPVRHHISCPESPFVNDSSRQSSLAISYLLSNIENVKDNFVMQILNELLTSGPNAPFYKNILGKEIGSGYSPVTGFDNSNRDTFFTIGIQGISDIEFEKVIALVDKTFEEVYQNGFEKERIEAILHSIELGLKHKTQNFGLNLLMSLVHFWNHSDSAINYLQVNENILWLKEQLKNNPNFFNDKIKEFFIKNNHKLIQTMSPKSDFEECRKFEEDESLKKIESSLSDGDKKTIINNSKKLLQMQSKEEDLSILPILTISDLKKDVQTHIHEYESLSGLMTQINCCKTNDVSYFNALISTKDISSDLKPCLPIFCSLLSMMGAGKYNYSELDTAINLHTGGFSASTFLHEHPSNLCLSHEAILLSSYCLSYNINNMYSIWSEIFNYLKFEDENRLGILMNMLYNDVKDEVINSGHNYAMTNAGSSFSQINKLREEMGGLNYINFLSKISSKADITELSKKLQAIGEYILRKSNMKISLNTTDKLMPSFIRETENFLNSIPSSTGMKDYSLKNYDSFVAKTACNHFVRSFPINFASKSVPTVEYTHNDYAPLQVLAKLVSGKFLLKEIREKGGAYGAGALVSPGCWSFYSYRDPNSVETFKAFDASIDWVLQEKFTDEHIFESKIGVIKKVDAPVMPYNMGLRNFLNDISDEMFIRYRENILAVEHADLIRVAETYFKNQSIEGKTLIGPKNEKLNKKTSWKIQ